MFDLLRIALAETDELAAYLIQAQLRKLGRPFSMRRIADHEALGVEIARFAPHVLICDRNFASRESVCSIAQKTELPVIFLSSTENATPEALSRETGSAFVHLSGLKTLPLILEKILLNSAPRQAPWNHAGPSEQLMRATASV